MVSQSALACKKDLPRFLMVPWSEASPELQALEQSLPVDHLARLIREGMTLLNPQLLRDAYAGSGSPAYPPERLLAVVLFEYQAKRPRPSQWCKDATENSAVRWLLQGLTPSRTVWYDFRRRVSEEQLLQYQQTLLKHARQGGMTTGQSGALDGTLVAANASRHHLAKQQKVQERTAQLDAAIARDQNSLPVEPPAWMGKTAARRLQQQDQYRRVGQRMEQLQAKNRQKRASKRQDPAKIRVSISDPEAAVGYDKLDVFRPLYNVQIAGRHGVQSGPGLRRFRAEHRCGHIATSARAPPEHGRLLSTRSHCRRRLCQRRTFGDRGPVAGDLDHSVAVQ
jgi:transposase